jgi:hypothetical protein
METAQNLEMMGVDGKEGMVLQGISDAFSLAWCKCAKEVTITSHSKPWWNQECADAICHYREDRSLQKFFFFFNIKNLYPGARSQSSAKYMLYSRS